METPNKEQGKTKNNKYHLESFVINAKCLKCGGEATVSLADDGGCSDPECCGGATYHIEVSCDNKKCRNIESIY